MEAAAALRPLAAVADDDPRWQTVAAPTDWTVTHTIEHIPDTLLFYSGQVARRATRGYGIIRNGRDTKPSGHLRDLETATAIFTAVLRDLGDARALHPSGNADGPGWVGMAVTEMLVHGYDAAAALDVPITLPEDVCARTLERVFPWVERGTHSAVTMLLCETGRVTVDGVTGPEDWWWQAEPLSEWDGKPRRRTLDPAWR
ncbi:MAG: hypothetical protein JWN96_129 [Mycobacterium sp.]|nr:hypothetical protein [Mycobacterium sp.]